MDECKIPELENFLNFAKYLYSKSGQYKKYPQLNIIFACLSSRDIDISQHMNLEITGFNNQVINVNLFNNNIPEPQFIGIKQIMSLETKMNSDLEITIKMTTPPIP